MSDPTPRESFPPQAAPSPFDAVLNRPPADRLREYKYRFAQSTVFGLPVVALHFFGPALGGPEAGRWIGMLQLLLAGWVMYVGAVGMLVEAMLRRRITADGFVAGLSIVFYVAATAARVRLLATGVDTGSAPAFWWAVVCIAGWSGARWFLAARTV